jgi:hypothetical protein
VIGLSTFATVDRVDVGVSDAALDARRAMVADQMGQVIWPSRSDDEQNKRPECRKPIAELLYGRAHAHRAVPPGPSR